MSEERHHARTHAERSGHIWSLNIKRKAKPRAQRVSCCVISIGVSNSQDRTTTSLRSSASQSLKIAKRINTTSRLLCAAGRATLLRLLKLRPL